jgi:hypothetical protein
MASIWITVVLGVITAVTGGLAGHLAAQKTWHKWAFWGSALFTVGLLFVQGVLMQKDIKDAEERGKQEHAQLNRIEKNTGQPPNVIISPPVVNISPPAPAVPALRSQVALDHFESSYDQTVNVNNIPTRINQLFKIGDPISLNLFFKNTGNAVADKVWSAGQVIFATSETDDDLISAFKSQLKEVLAPAIRTNLERTGGVIEMGGTNTYWFTQKATRPLQADDVTKLQNGKERLVFLTLLSYHDPLGSHHIHLCEWLQPPVANVENQPAVWHFCQGFNDRD